MLAPRRMSDANNTSQLFTDKTSTEHGDWQSFGLTHTDKVNTGLYVNDIKSSLHTNQ